MHIDMDNRTTHSLTSEQERIITEVIGMSLKLHQMDDAEVSLVFVDNNEIQQLNKNFRGMDKPTDVLSFPQFQENLSSPVILGDIVISIEKAQAQAVEYGHSFERELGFLCAHSMLHLLGYDHMEEADEKEMFALQEEILEKVGVIR